MTEPELLEKVSQLEAELATLREKEAGYVRQLQRDATDLKKKDQDRLAAKLFLETVRDKTEPGTTAYEDVDRLIQMLRTR